MKDEDLKQVLKRDAAEFAATTPSAAHVFVHYFQEDDAATSQVARRNNGTAQVNTHRVSGEHLCDGVQPGSERTFSDHSRIFGPAGTMLSWINNWIERFHRFSTEYVVTISITRRSKKLLQAEHKEHTLDIKVSQKVAHSLCPPNVARLYIGEYISEKLDHRRAELHDFFRDLFMRHRGQAIGLFDQSKQPELTQLTGASQDSAPVCPGSSDVRLDLLAALQSILVFHTCNTHDQAIKIWMYRSQSGSNRSRYVVVRVPAARCDAGNHRHETVVPAGTNNRSTSQHEVDARMRGCLAERVSKIEDLIRAQGKRWDSTQLFDLLEDSCPISRIKHLDAIDKVFNGSSSFREWRKCLALWQLAILQQLRRQVHEGQRLGFWFVAGDQSAVLDSRLFVYRALDAGSIETLAVPQKVTDASDNGTMPVSGKTEDDSRVEIRDRLVKAARAVGRLNYPWFQDGRYALFWDATSPSIHPLGLLEIRNSTWDRWEATLERLPADSAPTFMLAHCRPDGTSGFALGTKRVLLARRGDSQWLLVNRDRRKEWLLAILLASIAPEDLGSPDPEVLEVAQVLADIALRVAEDPHRGCMLIVFKRAASPVGAFRCMGDPWQPAGLTITDANKEDLVALVSMDGATCIYRSTSGWLPTFRRLIVAREEPVLNMGDHPHFMGMGSRRWGAAHAAVWPGVGAVIVVSQDGDVQIWRNKDRSLRMSHWEVGTGSPGKEIDVALISSVSSLPRMGEEIGIADSSADTMAATDVLPPPAKEGPVVSITD